MIGCCCRRDSLCRHDWAGLCPRDSPSEGHADIADCGQPLRTPARFFETRASRAPFDRVRSEVLAALIDERAFSSPGFRGQVPRHLLALGQASVQRERRAGAAREDLLVELLVARLERAIDGALAELSPELRAAFLLREYHDLDYVEIAEALAIDLGTVKSRLSRARARLRERLAGERHD